MTMNSEPLVSFHMPLVPGVTLIVPGSAAFSAAAQSVVDPLVFADIEPLLPFCYVLRNNTDKSIIVYSTRWTLTDSLGTSTTQDATWWNLSSFRGGDAIEPGASRLVSPIFRLGVTSFGPTGSALSKQLRQTLADFNRQDKLAVSLETVIFADGTAIGTDATGAIVSARAYLDGEREVKDLFAQTMAAQGDVIQLLTNLVGPPGARTYVSNPPQYEESLAARKRSLANSLLHLIQPGSNAADRLKPFQQKIANKPIVRIVKAVENQ
jgi:hypothetical protein